MPKRRPRYLLDTGVLIRHLRHHGPTTRLLRELGRQDFLAISAITRLEIRVGMREQERYITNKLLSRLITLDIDAEVADLAGDLLRKYRNTQTPLTIPDAIIAATALRHGLILVTYNPKDFPMPNLLLYPTNP